MEWALFCNDERAVMGGAVLGGSVQKETTKDTNGHEYHWCGFAALCSFVVQLKFYGLGLSMRSKAAASRAHSKGSAVADRRYKADCVFGVRC